MWGGPEDIWGFGMTAEVVRQRSSSERRAVAIDPDSGRLDYCLLMAGMTLRTLGLSSDLGIILTACGRDGQGKDERRKGQGDKTVLLVARM